MLERMLKIKTRDKIVIIVLEILKADKISILCNEENAKI